MRFRERPLQELRDLAESVVTVAAAAEAGIFEALHTRPAAPDELARRLDLDARATAVALPVLEELGLLERDGGAGPYRLSERGRRELGDRASPGCQAGGLPLWLENLRAFSRLAEALRSGRPIDRAGAGDEVGDEGGDEVGDENEEERREGIARFMAGMAAAPEERVSRLVDGVLARRPEAGRVLDLGGGPGHIARAFARRAPEVVLLDRPEIVDFVRDEYALDGVEGLRTVGGDFLTEALPEGPFDVVLLSNILHMLSPEECRGLLRRARGVMAPGGVVAIADFLRGRSSRAARFALVMLLRTERGNTYTFEDHEAWLDEAGFTAVELADLDPERQLVTALVPGLQAPH